MYGTIISGIWCFMVKLFDGLQIHVHLSLQNYCLWIGVFYCISFQKGFEVFSNNIILLC